MIIIGGGHAGTEAALASAKLGAKTLMVTLKISRIGFLSCNPAIGGLAKGQIVKEIDALGGLMALNTDRSAIQYRRLNSKKGPAVRSSRAQCDKDRYAQAMLASMQQLEGLSLLEAEVMDIRTQNGRVMGIQVREQGKNPYILRTSSVVITSGTFLKAVMHMGSEQRSGGRQGDSSSQGLSRALLEHGFQLSRLKTGTPPRLHRESIDYGRCIPQAGDEDPAPFSFYFREVMGATAFPMLPQLNCFITHTNTQTHEIIDKNKLSSPMYSGQIQGKGPRYCPSIEDKVHRFAEKERHQIFLEPEGLDVDEVYVNGISTSLSREVQEEFVRSISGLEDARFIRYGYAVEYDAVDARQLKRSLESKDIAGLFLAGQVNGTSGYEEAGGQGLVAGANAALSALDEEPFILQRTDGYIGVLIDDLITKGTDEPYRMFTSRCEYRLLHREDNADLRLSDLAFKRGLLEAKKYERFLRRQERIEKEKKALQSFYFKPSRTVDRFLREAKGMHVLKDRVSAADLLKRPGIRLKELISLGYFPSNEGHLSADVIEQVEIQAKYQGYIERDMRVLEKVRRNEDVSLPLDLDYDRVFGLSNEVKSRFKAVRPESLGQASRIQGVTPAAVANLYIHVQNHLRPDLGTGFGRKTRVCRE